MDFLNYLDDVPLWLAIPLVIINLVLWGLLILPHFGKSGRATTTISKQSPQ